MQFVLLAQDRLPGRPESVLGGNDVFSQLAKSMMGMTCLVQPVVSDVSCHSRLQHAELPTFVAQNTHPVLNECGREFQPGPSDGHRLGGSYAHPMGRIFPIKYVDTDAYYVPPKIDI